MICWQTIKAGRLTQLYDLFQAGVYRGVKSTVPIGTSERHKNLDWLIYTKIMNNLLWQTMQEMKSKLFQIIFNLTICGSCIMEGAYS